MSSAKRAVRRDLAHLTRQQVFLLAAMADTFRYGDDRGHWQLSALWAENTPSYQWKCDKPSSTGGA